jgi:Zn-finger nucleic acid-binding protein
VAPTANCPDCSASLALTNHGTFDAWVCPAGHGLAATLSEVYERAQEDDLATLWRAARAAVPGSGHRACPMCQQRMVAVDAAVDPDEAKEGEPGDGPATHEVPVDVCVRDQVIWFDVDELEAMPADLPEPAPTAEHEAALQDIRSAWGESLEAAGAGRADLADRVLARVRRSPRAFDAVSR